MQQLRQGSRRNIFLKMDPDILLRRVRQMNLRTGIRRDRSRSFHQQQVQQTVTGSGVPVFLFGKQHLQIRLKPFRLPDFRILLHCGKLFRRRLLHRLEMNPEKRQFRRIRRSAAVPSAGKQNHPFACCDTECTLLFEQLKLSRHHMNQFIRINHPHRMPAVSAGNKTSAVMKLKPEHCRFSPQVAGQPPARRKIPRSGADSKSFSGIFFEKNLEIHSIPS